jgi:hemerythrin-like domain-containing protein
MDTATKNLENDHVYILRLIDVMEQMVLTVCTELSHIELAVSLIINFADGFHHVKEENLLFPMLVTKGFSNEQGPIPVMLHDHTEARKFVKEMAETIETIKQGDPSVFTSLYDYMQGYIDLLRAHIGKENNVLFRMADKALTPEEQQSLLKSFAAVEVLDYSKGQLERLITEIEGLEAIYKPYI